ncbi:hypothetical protein C0995_002249 [Termitomyces sp. Mi166|nr:hypothetical protein C0995_002249 [Termitomyces sp. Mi166\
MELGMLTPQQRKAPQPHSQSKAKQASTVEGKQGSKGKGKQRSKGKGKQHETAMPATPKRNLAPQVPSSPAEVEVISRSHEQTTRSMLRTHPRYEIFIRGCSKRVYNVIGEVSYSTLLAHKDILAEHPRDGGYLDAIRRMKPYWVTDSSYHWATMRNESRLGASVVPYDEGEANDSDVEMYYDSEDEDEDEEDENEEVKVNEYEEITE